MVKQSFVTLLASALVALSPATHSATTTQMLGDQDFADGQSSIGTGTFTSAAAGDSAPFNSFIGSDVNGPNFSASFAFGYGAIAGTIGSATIQIGLYDGDSVASGNQVASFTVDGFDLTALLNAVMESTPGTSGQENYYTVTIPSAAFALLADGSASFALSLAGPGSGILGETTFNGAGLDFATIAIDSRGGGDTVPEPTSLALLLGGLLGLPLGRWINRRG